MLTKAQQQRATGKDIDQKFAAAMICSLKDVLDGRGIPWLPFAQVALEVVWVSGATGDGHFIEHWMSGLTYYTQMWMVKCEVEV